MNKNLIPFDAMSSERHRELSARGGRASGEARRNKKALREQLQAKMEQYAQAEGFIDDIGEFNRWKKRRAKARAKRERTTGGIIKK